MDDFHCESLDLAFSVSAEGLDKNALLKAAGHDDEEYSQLRLIFGSSSNPDAQHAHINIRFFPEDRTRVGIGYHNSPGDVEDAQPPYMEDCVKWLAGFIRDEKVSASVSSSFAFDGSYTSRIPMPFPLLMSDERLKGALVTGLSLSLPKELGVDKALLIHEEDVTFLSTFTEKDISLKDFDFYEELNGLSSSVMSLVKKQETTDENSRKE